MRRKSKARRRKSKTTQSNVSVIGILGFGFVGISDFGFERKSAMNKRRGFTIVELLVAMALIMFMMAILSEAFSAGLGSFRTMKASADMADRLRSAATVLRRELAADHFDGRRRLSQADFWTNGPPAEGFFRVYQGSPVGGTYVNEGSDPDEAALPLPHVLDSYRATDHMLHFTVKFRGNERGDFFSAGNIPAGSTLLTSPLFRGERHYQENGQTTYRSQWAEVAYFLRQTTDTTKGGTPLYTLFRRQWLLVPDNGLLTTPITGANAIPRNYLEMSCNQVNVGGVNALYFNNPRDVTMPGRRMGMNTPAANNPADPNLAGLYTMKDPTNGRNTYPTMGDTDPNYQGSDIILTDVISFEVRLLLNDSTHFETLFDIAGVGANNPRVNSVAIKSVAPTTGNTVLVTTQTPHNFFSGWNVQMTAGGAPTTFTIASTPSATTFTYTNPVGTALPVGGVATSNNSYQLSNGNFNANVGPLVFDTWSNYNDTQYNYLGTWNATNVQQTGWSIANANASIPFYGRALAAGTHIRPRAIQILIRVWDSKTELTRQVSVIQDL
jgi:prepilin-type N-terminal cleavage/methylation domain-containing protein